jgi:hypothetical protein
MDIHPEGQTYAQRYHVHDYPHLAIIDPRTRRLMWSKEGWTQEKPLTSEDFAETAMDFCSRHSFDKPPVAPRPSSSSNGASSRPTKRPMHEMSEDEQLQAAMRASLQQAGEDDGGGGGGDDDEVVMEDDDNDGVDDSGATNGNGNGDMKPQAVKPQVEEKKPSFMEELVAMPLGDEPDNGARIQLRMPDGKRVVRKFVVSETVKTIYAFVAVSTK